MSPPLAPDDEVTRIQPPRAAVLAQPAATAMDLQEIRGLAAANPVLRAANPLLMMLRTLRSANPPANLHELRERLIDMLKAFDAALVAAQLPDRERSLASYAVCAVVDECVQMTPWGGTANWAQQSLLIHFHGDNWGGEKFFEILNRLAAQPARYGALLELFYAGLALGFMGRFHTQGPAGRQKVAELRDAIYQLIRQGKAEPDRTLSVQWRGLEVAGRRFRGFGAVGVSIGGLALLCLGCFALYWWSLGTQLATLELDKLTFKKSPPQPYASAKAAKPRLEQLLSPEVLAQKLSVRDLKLESIVTLRGEGVFESGSATPSNTARPLIDRIGDALQQLEGRVVVTGHTDDVRPRSLRYAGNWELSKARAENVARLVAARLSDPSRVSFEGRGETEHVAGNGTPEGRALNRRVEVVLKAADANP